MIHEKGSPLGGVIKVAAAVLVALPALAFAAVPASDTGMPLRGPVLAQAEVPATDAPGGAGLTFEIRSYRVEGNTLLPLTDVERLLRAYTGKSRDFGDVQQALEALQALYTERGYAGIQITLPEQELDRGDVIFKVIEPRIARVLVEGNEHFSADNARRSVPSLVPGTTPNTRQIAASVRVANESPAKQSAVLLRPVEREGEGEVDAVIRVADVAPLRYSVSLDNTGNKETGKYRVGFAL